MILVPNSWGSTLREDNDCHSKEDGRFCSSPSGGTTSVQDTLRKEFPGVELTIHDKRNPYGAVLYLDTINVLDKTKRRTGIGTRVMNRLVDLADERKATIAVDPSSDFGSSLSRLKRFYARFGFKPNRGRYSASDITGAMIRYPGGTRSRP